MCVKTCLCNSCFKKDTCSDCKHITDHEEADCYATGIIECEWHVERVGRLASKKCKYCNGTGMIWRKGEGHWILALRTESKPIPCPKCYGKGTK